jgi:heat-inducible transcriptional repressor
MLDERAQILLKTLVERYIEDGQPVASRALTQASGLDLSAATIRHVMSDLENLGLIASPHTSAGRVPTARGYRLFVDTMLTIHQQDLPAPQLAADQPQKVIAHAAQILSSLSNFVGVVIAPRKTQVLQHLEFLRLGERRVLLITVTPDGDVQNRVLLTAKDYKQSELIEASNFINHHYSGLALGDIRTRLAGEAVQLQSEIAALMHAALHSDSTPAHEEQVVLAGERKLLGVSDFSSNISQLRRAYELFEHKAELMQLLESSEHGQGVRIFIGGESQTLPVQELSIVSAPYAVNGDIVGTLGVIGPTRMRYERMVQIVDITAKLVGNALSYPQA